MLNPVWLKTFRTLVETGHFTRTAEQLCMTQPGVSQHVRKLEEACGHSLIRREKKSFELTEQGHQVYLYAGQLERNEADLLEQLNFDDPESGSYRLACSGAMALQLYPVLLDLQCRYPGLTVQLEVAPNYRIINDVQQGEIDLGIVTQLPETGLLSVQEIGHEPLCLILPASDRNSDAAKNQISDEIAHKLKALGLIHHPDVLHYLSLYCHQAGILALNELNPDQLPVAGYINQLSQILLPIAKGLGFTVLPKSAVDSFAEPEKLELFQAANPVSEPLYLVTKRHRILPARFDTVMTRLTEHFSER